MTSLSWTEPAVQVRLVALASTAPASELEAGAARLSVRLTAPLGQTRWVSPHPPGTHFNIDRRTRAEVVDDRTVRLCLPEVDGLVLGKLRATHVMSERFWRDVGFGYARDESGEGHW